MRQLKLSLLASTLIFVTPQVFAAPVAKQLAGPPSEFAAMAEPDLHKAAVVSRSAMVPVKLTQDKQGEWRWQTTIPVEEPNLRFALFTGAADNWHLSMRAPHARQATAAELLASDKREMLHGMGNNEYPADYYSFEHLTPGEWTLSIAATDNKQTDGFILLNNDSPHRLRSYQQDRNQRVGERIGFTAYGFTANSKSDALTADATSVDARMVDQAHLRVTAPSGTVWTEAMYDDGLHGDEKAGDGIFGGDFLALEQGDYTVQVVSQGRTPDGMPMLRTAEHLVPVINRETSLAADFATSTLINDHRMTVGLALSNRSDQSQYRVFAEVWGQSLSGSREAVPVAWIGGMVTAKNGTLDLGLDARWIALAGAQGPFELRNLRVEDPDYFIPVLRAERMNLDMPRLPQSAFRAVRNIDEEMLMGPRPTDIQGRAGARLLMVHGYCATNSWGPVAGQFSGESIFLDLDQNRSHNQFALRILSFGSSYSSYGIVAHSQGGAASLHLYTYYWSGLDFAGPGRLIQSLGTPYQGTSLAGNLAVLGQIFGVGCGTNYDLSYNGAASWLSGIPAWARYQVNYYTTSFTDKWWRYDYCQFVTDLLLNDPDDGVTERSRGQLGGAFNRGHRTGWCHTTEMRDPGQVRDSNRNAIMNANAAR